MKDAMGISRSYLLEFRVLFTLLAMTEVLLNGSECSALHLLSTVNQKVPKKSRLLGILLKFSSAH